MFTSIVLSVALMGQCAGGSCQIGFGGGQKVAAATGRIVTAPVRLFQNAQDRREARQERRAARRG